MKSFITLRRERTNKQSTWATGRRTISTGRALSLTGMADRSQAVSSTVKRTNGENRSNQMALNIKHFTNLMI